MCRVACACWNDACACACAWGAGVHVHVRVRVQVWVHVHVRVHASACGALTYEKKFQRMKVVCACCATVACERPVHYRPAFVLLVVCEEGKKIKKNQKNPN